MPGKDRSFQPVNKEEYVKTLFDGIAEGYDRMNRLISLCMVGRWQRVLAESCFLEKNARVLDVCTGTGEIALLLARRAGPGALVIGLDFSGKMLNIAREKLLHCCGERATLLFLQGNALRMPFPDGFFDCVTCGLALRNVSHVQGALSEMARVCKKGGQVLILEIAEPQALALRVPFRLYFNYLIPLIGKLAGKGGTVGDGPSPYKWLPQSLQGFPQREKLSHVFKQAGFGRVSFIPLSGGVVNLHRGEKQ